MNPQWEALDADQPAEFEWYVEPPGRPAERIVQLLRAGGTTVLLAGPRGIGKLTELRFAARVLEGERKVVRFSIPRGVPTTPNGLLSSIAEQATYGGTRGSLNALIARETYGAKLVDAEPEEQVASALNRLTINARRRVVLMVDGLEHLPGEIAAALSHIPATVDIVATIPWALVYGHGGEFLIRPADSLVIMPPYSEAGGGGHFLISILQRQLGLFDADLATNTAIGSALAWSGGIPQIFLQLLREAGHLARMRSEAWPTIADIQSIVAARVNAIRRQLLPGDKIALRAADGTDGSELELDRKLRYLDQCLLLESTSGAETRLTLHPFARAAARADANGKLPSIPGERSLPGLAPKWTVAYPAKTLAVSQLDITTYRGISGTRFEQLRRVNLLVGLNNAGKTSVLEAFHILAHRADPRGVHEALERRARGRAFEDPSWRFAQLPSFSLRAVLVDEAREVFIEGTTTTEPESADEDRAIYLGSLKIRSVVGNEDQQSTTDYRVAKRWETRLTGSATWLFSSVLQSPFSASDQDRLAEYHAKSVESGAHDDVVHFIREHIDPDLLSIDFIQTHERFLVNHKRFKEGVDLSSFGDGLQRVYRIGLLFAAARHGIVLIDEFENAIHTSVLGRLAALIHDLAVKFNVQVLLTTHSKETIEAFVLDDSRAYDVVAYGLYREDEGIRVARYSGRELSGAIEAIDLDIRWPP
jgi:hypothetical protein